MTDFAVFFTPRAERQLLELFTYIAADRGVAVAEKFLGKVVGSCMSLGTFPGRGNKRDDIRPNLRTKSYARRVTIAFSVNQQTATVAIHGVFYGGQDFGSVLRETDHDD